MKRKNILAIVLLQAALAATTSCQNDDIEFGDFDYQAVYFASQSPVRTITLGEDVYSTDLDNEHRFQIYARLGGAESNKKDRTISIAVDETLVNGLLYDDGTPVKALPRSYYTLGSNTITIAKGQMTGCVDIQLTDDFFADPLATQLTYVLPVRMVSASDSILSGEAKSGVTSPNIVDAGDWDTQPMNYTLYGLKYKNKYHGCWLSKGTDRLNVEGRDSTITRMPDDWEDASLVYLTTESLWQARYAVSVNINTLDSKGKATIATKTCDLLLTFDDDGRCTVGTDTEGCTASGSGQWTYHGATKAWNKKDRDQITLDYNITFSYLSGGESVTTTLQTSETLVMRDRQSKYETFSYTVQ